MSKKCAGCGQYFAGELNGDYLCAGCAHLEAPRRPLSDLSSLDGAMDFAAGYSDYLEEPSGRRPSGSEGSRNAKGQAA